MPRTCTICNNPQRDAIDLALLAAHHAAEELKRSHSDRPPPERLNVFVDWVLEHYPLVWLEGNTQETVFAFLALLRDLQEALSPDDVLRRPLSTIVRDAIRRRDGNRCTYCGALGDDTTGPNGRTWHVDHVVPWSKSWDDSPSNLALACSSCNIRKRDRDAETFRRRLAECNASATESNA